MAKLALLVAFIAACVAAVGALLAATQDGELLTTPPEIVAESFMKQLKTDRFDRALPFLTEELRKKRGRDDLENFKNEFEQKNGRIEDVHGEERETGTERATASAKIKTDRTETALAFTMTRERHEWKINELPELSE